jgi:hypothetical protein
VNGKVYNKQVEMLTTTAVVKKVGGVHRFLDNTTELADSGLNASTMLNNCTTRVELSFRLTTNLSFNQQSARRTMNATLKKVEKLLLKPFIKRGFSVRDLWRAFWAAIKSMVFLSKGLHVMVVYGRNASKYVG